MLYILKKCVEAYFIIKRDYEYDKKNTRVMEYLKEKYKKNYKEMRENKLFNSLLEHLKYSWEYMYSKCYVKGTIAALMKK